ncbi:methyltransferase family protein [Hyphococcus sp.]|uniref:methyltransferase family protein n=1 Tax=Hyphococcus sp. TaxID=2038636 RepID=UPI00207F61B9|nr:MAG: S-isoprenylcysteine methyltransferase-like protein [Marinicaulis sp.]
MTDQAPRPSILVIIPPPVWALIFSVASWLAGRALELSAPLHHPVAGWAVFVFGFLISASGRMAFSKAGTEVVPVSKKNSALVIDGPFKFTRNPMYLGILVATIGLALVIGTILAIAAPIVFFLFVNFISIPYEEEKMERQFGEDYLAYKQRVRRWL